MKILSKKIAIDYLIFLVLFMAILPLGYTFGLISVNTISLWGRYFCFAIAAIGLDMLWGYTGILCMCQALFFCIGGYGIAMHMSLSTASQGSYGAAIPDFMVWNQVTELPFFWKPFEYFPLAIAFGILVPLVFASFFGYFIFKSRLKGVYFAIITQALALAMWLLFLRNETMLGGTNGLTNFKQLGGLDLSQSSTKLTLYLISCISLILIYIGSKKLVNSKFGKVLVAIRDSESRIRYTSYEIKNYQIAIFAIAAVIAAIGGMLYVPQTGIITPGRMDVKASIEMIIWVALGGRGKLKGAVFGTLLVNFMYSVFTSVLPGSWLYVIGILFIVTVLYMDQGIIGLPKQISKYMSKLKAAKV